jgi:hypothetical protein
MSSSTLIICGVPGSGISRVIKKTAREDANKKVRTKRLLVPSPRVRFSLEAIGSERKYPATAQSTGKIRLKIPWTAWLILEAARVTTDPGFTDNSMGFDTVN